jgi:hypothetical protein
MGGVKGRKKSIKEENERERRKIYRKCVCGRGVWWGGVKL